MKTRCQIVHESVFCLSDSTRSICPHRSCTRSPTTPWAWCSHPSRASPTSTPRPRWTTREWSAWGCSTKLSLTLTRWDCSWGGPASTFRRPLFLNESIHLLPRTLQNRLMQRQRTSAHLCRWSEDIYLRQKTWNTQNIKYYEHLPSRWIQVWVHTVSVWTEKMPVKFSSEQIWFSFGEFLAQARKLAVW